MDNFLNPPVPPDTSGVASSPAPAKSKGFDIVDLKQYLHIVMRRIWLVALCFAISVSFTMVMVMRKEPVYRSAATLLLSRGLPIPSELQQKEIQPLGDYIFTQMRIIQSGLILQRARERVGKPPGETRDLLLGLDVGRVYKTSILKITVDSLEPRFASDFANAVAEEYIRFKAEERMDTSQATVVSLTQQANRLREELKRAEERVLAFEKDNKVVAIQQRGNIAANYLARLSARAAGYRTQRMLLEAEQPLISQAADEIVLATLATPLGDRPEGEGTSIGSLAGGEEESELTTAGVEGLVERGVVRQPGWENLRRQKGMLESELAYLRTKFHDAHPEIQRVLQRLKGIDRALDVELQFALRQYYTKLEALEIKERAAQRVEMEWEDEALEGVRRAHEYKNLRRGAGRLEGLYDLIFNRLKEIDVSIGIEPESVRIMERAHPSGGPISAGKLKSILLAALIGLGVGLAAVFGLEYLDDSLRYPEEVTQGLQLPFFGVIPSAKWDPEDLRSHILSNIDQKSGLAEAYRNVRSALLFSGTQDSGRSVVVTSAVPLEGKTTTCLNLAVSLSQAGSRVLMVDGDLRRGELHKFFGLQGGKGFADVLAGQAKPEAVIQRTGLPNLDLMATGPFPPNPAELVLSPEMGALLDYAKRTYDRVLFDCPPVMAVSEAGTLCSLVEGVVFVVWAGQTSRKISQLAVQVLRERGARILGCVLNNLEFGRVGYYYYSTYYGYYDYGYSYDRGGPGKRGE